MKWWWMRSEITCHVLSHECTREGRNAMGEVMGLYELNIPISIHQCSGIDLNISRVGGDDFRFSDTDCE